MCIIREILPTYYFAFFHCLHFTQAMLYLKVRIIPQKITITFFSFLQFQHFLQWVQELTGIRSQKPCSLCFELPNMLRILRQTF